jgi:DNA (cytosine-5)-methyltransferase 3A
MNVLSLFDGMSGGQIALTELDIPIDKYYASEIDKYAMQFTIQNFPNTIQVGDIRELDINKLDKIDLLIGGSPCQSLSMAGKRKGLSTKEGVDIFDLEMYLELKENGFEFEGQSYLFWEYIRIYNDLLERGDNPKFFLENVEMGKKWESVFNDILGRKGIHINSALVSAQNRRRIYWTDIHDDIPQPEDRGGILLKDILEEEVDEKYFLSDKMIECLKGRVKTGNDPTCVAMTACLTPKRTEYGKKIRKEYEAGIVKEQIKNIQRLKPKEDRKINCLTTVQKNNLIIVSGTIRTFGGKHFREIKSGKSCTLMARARNDGNAQPCVQIGAKIRRLTPTECARLQTVPERYIWDGISDTQRYKMLGNGWNIETIKHIFKYLRR